MSNERTHPGPFPPRLTVAIAGASGFVGQALVGRLSRSCRVIALGRGEERSEVEARRCDLFSLHDAKEALQGVKVAVYLVHSMMPTARLAQGNFEDFDLVCADNFARAAQAAGVERIVYLGGLIPEGEDLSRHLRSRKEVEATLASRGVPVTTLRAGLVIGAGGSSYQMMKRLVERLPVMVCPRWTTSRTQPIALDDVVELLAYCVTHHEEVDGVHDIGSPDVLSYVEMMHRTAALMGKKIRVLPVPFFTPHLSLWWVSLITGAPMSLVEPLVESLRHDMVARDAEELPARAGLRLKTFDQAMTIALSQEPPASQETPRPSGPRNDGSVRSVQRMTLPEGWDAVHVADEYMRWLPVFFHTAIRVVVDRAGVCQFRVPFLKQSLLELTFVPSQSSADRRFFFITGGLLCRHNPRGRLEFCLVPGRQEVVAAIHDFVPTLPWFFYVATQARVHLFVMQAFGRHLARVRAAPAPPISQAAAGPPVSAHP
jgi:uncharacterized protein YbjT (DUF2867 family)